MTNHRPYADDGEMRQIVLRIEASVSDVKLDVRDVAADVTLVKVQTTKTNGRVRSLELWRAAMTGGLAVLSALSMWLLWLVANGHVK